MTALPLVALLFVLCVNLPLEGSFVAGLSARRCPGDKNQCSLHGECMINSRGEYICKCQWGWTAPDCSQKMCPHGFDPTSGAKQEKKIRFILKASSGKIDGKLLLSFHGSEIEFLANGENLSTRRCTEAFRRFYTFEDLDCERETVDTHRGGSYLITFKRFPIHPVMNNLHRHDGNINPRDFSCDTTRITGATQVECIFESVNDDDIKVYAECSNHGVCLHESGECACDSGFHGVNCESNTDDKDVVHGTASGPFYSGSVARIRSMRAPSREFFFLTAESSRTPIFTLRGDGDATFHTGTLRVLDGGMEVRKGGLKVHDDDTMFSFSDVYIRNGKCTILSAEDEENVLEVLSSSTNFGKNLLFLEGFGDPSGSWNILQAKANGEVVVELNGTGTIHSYTGGVEIHSDGLLVHAGGIVVSEGGQVIEKGGLRVERGGLDVAHGGVDITEGKLSVREGRVSVSSSFSSVPVMELVSTNESFENAILSLQHRASSSPFHFLKAHNEDGDAVFDIQHTGTTTVHSGGVNIRSGGLSIDSGGQLIRSGGLTLESGDFNILSGKVVIQKNGFQVDDGGLNISNSYEMRPSLQLVAQNSSFMGTVLDVVVNRSCSTEFAFLEGTALGTETTADVVWSIRGDGTFLTRGGLQTSHGGSIRSHGPLVAQSTLELSTRTFILPIEAPEREPIIIPTTHSYIQLVHQKSASHTNLTARINSTNAVRGQVLYVHYYVEGTGTQEPIYVLVGVDQQDEKSLVRIHPAAIVAFMFDGECWISLTAALMDSTSIENVEKLTAKNDLNLGEIQLTVKDLQVGSQRTNTIATYGKGGKLEGHEELSYDGEEHILRAPKLEIGELHGRIDFDGSELTNVRILSGSLENVNLTARMIHSTGLMYLESSAFIGGALTVHGPVSGSGAYVDSSDTRFKTNVRPISNAMETIRALQGVFYELKVHEFPHRKFSNSSQIGFLAQDVQRVMPEVVSADEEGYLSLAYSRMVPHVVEGIKEVDETLQNHETMLKVCENQTAKLHDRVRDLENEVQLLAQMWDRMAAMNAKLTNALCSSERSTQWDTKWAEICHDVVKTAS